MADIGNLSFSVHLQDMTDADADKIKKKLENLSVSLNIDGNNIKVSNADIIKKQLEDAVKSVNLSSVNFDASSIKAQLETVTQNFAPKAKVELLKDDLSKDLQDYLTNKVFRVKITITKKQLNDDIKALGSFSIPATLKLSPKLAIAELKKSLSTYSVPIGISMKSSSELMKDIQEKMKDKGLKINISPNITSLRKSITDALKDKTFKADLRFNIKSVSVQQAIRDAFDKAGMKYDDSEIRLREQRILEIQQRMALAQEKANRAHREGTNTANRYNSALERINRTAERQKGLMAGIREQVANMYALYRIGRFLDGVIRISGEFQQQHVALQTILGDAEKADVLFQRIKGLAVESPFKFGDLTKYAKQLAAFSIPYEEMFDTLRRFGDLSAGLGVEMGRIILAYGQVRSAEFLKGTELRQFTEAGIPLVTELAKRYTELEGTLVSVGDVYDRISKKEIPFADVKAVLWDLTNEGGRFFNMQAVLTDTLKGKLDKLVDSYEIFLAEVGNSNNDVLGGTLELLTDILEHWELIQDAVMVAVSAYGVYKATLVTVTALQKAAMVTDGLSKMIASYQFLHNTTKAATVAQLAFNAASKANPYIVLASGLATIASGMFLLFRDSTESAAESLAKMGAEMQKNNELISANKQKAESLVSVMTNEKNTIESRKAAYDKLNRIYPSMFGNMTQEQALLLDEIRLRGLVADAAKKEAKEKLQASLATAEENVLKAKERVEYWDKFRTYKYENGEKIETTNIGIKEDADKAVAALNAFEDKVSEIKEAIIAVDKESEAVANRVVSRWFKEAEAYVNDLPEKYKSLMPKETEDREEYFKRIGEVVDNLNGKIKDLDSTSEAAKEILPNLTGERDAAKHIYTKILGGIDEQAQKDWEKLSKQNEKEAKEAAKKEVQAYLEALKNEISKIGSKWDLFKDLLEASGNKNLSMNIAFGGQISFDNQLEQLKSRIMNEAKKFGIGINLNDLLGLGEKQLLEQGVSEKAAKAIGALIDAYNKESAKLKDESVRNFIEILNASKDFEQQISDIERELQKDLADLTANSKGMSSEEFERRRVELIKKAEEDKVKVQFEEFKESSDWVKVFDDLDRVSDATLDNMISKIEEFAKQAHLSEEVTKQLVEAMGKLRDEAIERNPLEGFKDAWNRRKYYQSLKGKVGEYDEDGKLITQKMIDDGLAEANEDLKDSALAVADKFQAVANAADLLGGLFENLGIDLGGISDIFGGAASGAQAGAGIASALGMAGPWGAIAGAAVGMLSSVFAMHDKALQKEIEASEEREKLIRNISGNLEAMFETNLGGMYTMGVDPETKQLLKDYIKRYELYASNPYLSNRAIASKESYEKAQEALRQDSYYDAQKALLQLQRDELEHQMQLEDEKKKTDKSKIADYQQQIKEIEAEIENLALETANALYGIDFKGWANQLAESIVDAWSKGEDAVEAYKNTVNDILRDVGVSVISQKIIEPLLNNTMESFLAQFDKDNGKLTDKSMEILSGMADGAEYAASATEAYLEGLKKLGIDLSETADSEKGGLSKGIQSVTEDTEDTADLLASYLNSIRVDVSVKRSLIEKLIVEDVPQMNYLAQAQLQQLQMIVTNTKRNADVATEIRDLFNRVVDKGSNKLKV